MKKLLTIILLFLSLFTFGQNKLITKNGTITFEASVPSFEEINAKNDGVTCIINTKTGEIASLALVKGFRFKIALMEEHFNENYIESDAHPKATFKGKIENFDYSKLSTESKNYNIKGKLELHGKTKEINIIASIKKNSTGLAFISNFSVNTDDFGIKIPNMVSKKVSKKVDLKLDFVLK
ncbi:YceI family protein [Flavobacterium sp.]|uniref:YceI family protein n=1 Tax=Flavobacterium sp. TaxID=239 RepID=UPI003753644C